MKKDILVIFGGMSSEHEISCISASSILDNIDKEKYNVDTLGISMDGIWYQYIGKTCYIKDNTWKTRDEDIKKIEDIISYLKKYDVVFPVLHGKYGEDGTIQGVFEIAKVKYVGCKVLGSAIAINKILSKKLVASNNIPIVDYVEISKEKFDKIKKSNEYTKFEDEVKEKIGLPIIVKPSREGSSYGVVKVEKIEELKKAIDFSFKYDSDILIEKYIGDRQEIECSAIEKNGEVYISTPGEIVSANDLYDFNAKYKNAKSHDEIPANISKDIMERIKEYARDIFYILNLNSFSRIDFFVSNGNIYFNEVNTIPGFTDISMFPKMLIHDGISYKEIIDILIEGA